jgi:DNA (cytosine-5)-methyltransferase 1
VETLKLNHPNIPVHFGDMRSIDLKEYSDMDIDVLIGGIPYQPFSQIGKRDGLSNINGEIVFHFIQMTNVLKPKVFVVENVTGLLTLNNGEVLRFILKKFDDLRSYKMYVKVLNANDYSVPQNRKRLFIIGVKNTVNKVFKFPEEHDYKPVLRDALTNCRESDGRVYDKETRELFELIPEGGC